MKFKRLYSIVLVCLGLLLPVSVFAQENSGDWHYIFAPYLLGASLDGTTGIAGREVEINASFSDVLKNLQFGAMGHLEGSNGQWVVLSDFMYVGLGVAVTVPDSKVDINQWLFEGAIGHRVGRNLELFAGGRYNRIDGTIQFHGPFGIQVKGNQDWFDPFVGARVLLPLSEKASFRVRGDIGGFGVGSDFAWALNLSFGYRVSQRASLILFYRFLDMDYKNDKNGFIFNVTTSGPGVGIAFHF